MIRRHASAFRLALAGADAVSAVGLFVGISLLRFGDDWESTWRRADVDPLAAAVVYGAAWVALLWGLGLYRLRARWRLRTEILDVARAGVLLGLVVFSGLFVVQAARRQPAVPAQPLRRPGRADDRLEDDHPLAAAGAS